MALPKGVKSPVDYTKLYMSNELEGELTEKTMTPAQKRKDTMLKKKYEKSDDMMKSFKDQYGEKEGEKIFYAKIRKDAMKEELNKDDKPFVKKLVGKLRKGSKTHAKQADDLEKAMNEGMGNVLKKLAKTVGKKVGSGAKTLGKVADDPVKSLGMGAAAGGAGAILINQRKEINRRNRRNNPTVEENTAIESELVIQDWNSDDIKFTEIETVDIIKAKPLKENTNIDEGFKARMVAKLGKKLLKNIGKVNPFTKTGAQRVTQGSDGVIKKVTKKVTPPFDVTGKEAMKMKRTGSSKLDFPIDKVTSQNIQTQSIKNQAKKMVDMSKKPNKGTKAVKVDLSKPIDFDKYLGKTPNKIQKKFGSTTPTGTFTDDLPPVKTVPLKKSQLDLMKKTTPKKIKKKLTMKDKMKEIENDPMSKQIKKEIEKETGTKTRKFSQKGGVTKGNENEILSNVKPKNKKPLKDHYDWRTEIDEDWQKVNRQDKTDGLSKKAVKAYRRENPGSKLQTAVTKDPKKLKKGSKSAKRRLSFCRRMKGMKKKLTSAKTARDPDSRINKALRRWNC